MYKIVFNLIKPTVNNILANQQPVAGTLNELNDNLLDQYAKKYLVLLQFEKRLSKNTIEAYWNDLKRYINYFFLLRRDGRISRSYS